MKYVRLFLCALVICLLVCACSSKPAGSFFVASPSPSPSPHRIVVTPKPDALTAQDGDYTIAWISDTQYYCRSFPDTFYAMTAFLRDEAQRMNLRYVIHTGDLVNSYDEEAQWETAVRAMASIAHIPGGVCAGNHDVHHAEADYSFYSRYFGESQCDFRACYGESYEDNRGHYDLLDAGNTSYIFVYMGYAPDESCIRWVKNAFDNHPDQVGILCVHDYFETDLSLSDAGALFYKDVVRRCPNLYMVLCGHRYNMACVPAEFDDDENGITDRTVYQMLCNYQAAGTEGGSGYMRFLQVNESAGVIRMYSYSPLLQDYTYYDTPAHRDEKYAADPKDEQFTISIPWQ